MNTAIGKGRSSNRTVTGAGLPDILNYSNYRQFLRDYFLAQKQSNRAFSLRSFARKANFPSHTLVKSLMDGKRNLSQKSLFKLCLAMEFTKEETQHFENLVFFNQAKTLEEQQFYFENLVAASGGSRFKKLEMSQLQIFRHWYNIAIREMLNLKEFRAAPEWIAGHLNPPIETRAAAESLKLLLEAGLIKRTANGYQSVDPDITTDDEIKSFLVKRYHAQMLKLAERAQDEIPGRDRDVSSVCFAIKESELPKLKKQLQLMRKELRNFVAEAGAGERIVQVNIQMFPLTRGS